MISRIDRTDFSPGSPFDGKVENWKAFEIVVPNYIEYNWLLASIHCDSDDSDDRVRCYSYHPRVDNFLELDMNWIEEGFVYNFIAYNQQEDGSFVKVAGLSGPTSELRDFDYVLLT